MPALGWPLSRVSSFDLIPKCYRCKCSFLFMQLRRPYLHNPRFLEIWRSNFTSTSTSSTPSLFKTIVCSLHHQVLLYSESGPAKIIPYVWKPQFHTIPTAQRDSTFLGRQSVLPPNLQPATTRGKKCHRLCADCQSLFVRWARADLSAGAECGQKLWIKRWSSSTLSTTRFCFSV